MGHPMAGHLCRAGYEVLARDSNAQAVEDFHAENGGEPATSLEAIANTALLEAIVASVEAQSMVAVQVPGSTHVHGDAVQPR